MPETIRETVEGAAADLGEAGQHAVAIPVAVVREPEHVSERVIHETAEAPGELAAVGQTLLVAALDRLERGQAELRAYSEAGYSRLSDLLGAHVAEHAAERETARAVVEAAPPPAEEPIPIEVVEPEPETPPEPPRRRRRSFP
jgi:hypothetical protein